MRKLQAFALDLMLLLLVSPTLWARSSSSGANETVNVYSSRHYDVDTKLYDTFSQRTGIKVNVISGNAGETVERAVTEGENTQADLFFVTGADILYQLKSQDLLGKFPQKVLKQVPENLRDPNASWVAVSKRARVIIYDKTKNPSPAVTSYEDLVQGNNSLVIRSSSNSYNRMLLASILHANGEAATREWVRGLLSHMARPPQGNDRSQAKAVVAGLADYAIVNTYYVGLMLRSQDPAELRVGQALGIIFPNQDSRGTHVNISGLGLSKYAKNKSNAIALSEFLLSVESQQLISDENFEYPVAKGAKLNSLVASWGEFREDLSDLNDISAVLPMAGKIADEEGWQ